MDENNDGVDLIEKYRSYNILYGKQDAKENSRDGSSEEFAWNASKENKDDEQNNNYTQEDFNIIDENNKLRKSAHHFVDFAEKECYAEDNSEEYTQEVFYHEEESSEDMIPVFSNVNKETTDNVREKNNNKEVANYESNNENTSNKNTNNNVKIDNSSEFNVSPWKKSLAKQKAKTLEDKANFIKIYNDTSEFSDYRYMNNKDSINNPEMLSPSEDQKFDMHQLNDDHLENNNSMKHYENDIYDTKDNVSKSDENITQPNQDIKESMNTQPNMTRNINKSKENLTYGPMDIDYLVYSEKNKREIGTEDQRLDHATYETPDNDEKCNADTNDSKKNTKEKNYYFGKKIQNFNIYDNYNAYTENSNQVSDYNILGTGPQIEEENIIISDKAKKNLVRTDSSEQVNKIDTKFEEFKMNLKIKTIEERVKPILINQKSTSREQSNQHSSRVHNENIITNDQSQEQLNTHLSNLMSKDKKSYFHDRMENMIDKSEKIINDSYNYEYNASKNDRDSSQPRKKAVSFKARQTDRSNPADNDEPQTKNTSSIDNNNENVTNQDAEDITTNKNFNSNLSKEDIESRIGDNIKIIKELNLNLESFLKIKRNNTELQSMEVSQRNRLQSDSVQLSEQRSSCKKVQTFSIKQRRLNDDTSVMIKSDKAISVKKIKNGDHNNIQYQKMCKPINKQPQNNEVMITANNTITSFPSGIYNKNNKSGHSSGIFEVKNSSGIYPTKNLNTALNLHKGKASQPERDYNKFSSVKINSRENLNQVASRKNHINENKKKYTGKHRKNKYSEKIRSYNNATVLRSINDGEQQAYITDKSNHFDFKTLKPRRKELDKEDVVLRPKLHIRIEESQIKTNNFTNEDIIDDVSPEKLNVTIEETQKSRSASRKIIMEKVQNPRKTMSLKKLNIYEREKLNKKLNKDGVLHIENNTICKNANIFPCKSTKRSLSRNTIKNSDCLRSTLSHQKKGPDEAIQIRVQNTEGLSKKSNVISSNIISKNFESYFQEKPMFRSTLGHETPVKRKIVESITQKSLKPTDFKASISQSKNLSTNMKSRYQSPEMKSINVNSSSNKLNYQSMNKLLKNRQVTNKESQLTGSKSSQKIEEMRGLRSPVNTTDSKTISKTEQKGPRQTINTKLKLQSRNPNTYLFLNQQRKGEQAINTGRSQKF